MLFVSHEVGFGLQRIDSAMRLSQEQVPIRQSSYSEVEQLRVLRSKLVAAVEDILILIILRVRELKKNHLARLDRSTLISRCKAIKFALDHINLDVLVSAPLSYHESYDFPHANCLVCFGIPEFWPH